MVWLAIIGSSFAAGVIHTVTGFGAGVVIMMFLPYFMDLISAPAVNSTICLALSAVMTWRYRKALNWHLFLVPLLIYTIFATLCLQMVKGLNLDSLGMAFALFLILLSLYFLFFARKVTAKGTFGMAFLCAMISGICGALFGIGGPLMAIYFTSITKEKEEYAANLQIVFMLSAVIMLIIRISKGIYTLPMVPYTIVGFLSVALGNLVGARIADHLSATALRKIVYVGVGVSGVIMLIQKLL